MKAVILAGGKGTRFSEETIIRPKPMIELGGRPILWHIMKSYAAFGIYDFVICLGYKGDMIKEYFANYYLHQSDMTIDLQNNKVTYHMTTSEPWKVTLIDTGEDTLTGGRIKRIQPYINNEPFMLTYGDGVADIDIDKLVESHKKAQKKVTLTAVQPSGKFGALHLNESNTVTSFKEKPQGDGHWINGGFFVCEPEVFNLIDGDSTIWERYPLETLADSGELNAYKHNGFWHPMDKLHDKLLLTKYLEDGKAPWMTYWT